MFINCMRHETEKYSKILTELSLSEEIIFEFILYFFILPLDFPILLLYIYYFTFLKVESEFNLGKSQCHPFVVSSVNIKRRSCSKP